MAACLAAPWPSQQRGGRSTSERHSALARMRERHAGAHRLTPDDEPPARGDRQQPRPPAKPRPSSDARPAPRPGNFGGSGHADLDRDSRGAGRDARDLNNSHAEPWAPAWSPDSSRHIDDDLDSPPPKPQRPTPPGERDRQPPPQRSERSEARQPPPQRSERSEARQLPPQRSEKSDDGSLRSSRVRGPAEVRTARDVEAEDDCLPPGAQGADFKTLQAMIARGIQDAETGAVKLEKDIPPVPLGGTDEEEQRYRARLRLKREQEDAQRESDREKAKQKRRKEQQERERRQAEELEQEEREEVSFREQRAQAEIQCRREFAAAGRIQAHVRGRRSRSGKVTSDLKDYSALKSGLKAIVHWEPFMRIA